jgi:2-keto-3-deoxy-L-rhamnonate aldolase RhmA
VRVNKTKSKLKAGGVAFGVSMGIHDPNLVELSGALGFDFVVADCEHELFNEGAVEELARAADIYGLTMIVRTQSNQELILHALDSGAQGVLVARVNTREQAQIIVNACKFHPEGKRTIFFRSRGANFGLDVTSVKKWTREVNHETLIGCIIEEITGATNLKEILALPSVDFIDLGPLDLAHSMGWPAQEEVNRQIDKIVAESVKAGKSVMTQGNIETMPQALAQGFRMFTVSPRTYFQSGASRFLSQAKDLSKSYGLAS